MTFKRVKIRYKDLHDIAYFNHPFTEGGRIRLIDDIHLPASVSETSLATDFDGVDVANKAKLNATEREIIGETKEEIASAMFEFNNHINAVVDSDEAEDDEDAA